MAGEEKATGASTKVEEVAANVEQAAATRRRISGSKAEGVAKRYFAAIDQRDLDGAVALWAAGGRDNGAPGIRAHYHPNYYGAFVLDPDGHNIEAVCHAPE